MAAYPPNSNHTHSQIVQHGLGHSPAGLQPRLPGSSLQIPVAQSLQLGRRGGHGELWPFATGLVLGVLRISDPSVSGINSTYCVMSSD